MWQNFQKTDNCVQRPSQQTTALIFLFKGLWGAPKFQYHAKYYHIQLYKKNLCQAKIPKQLLW